MFTLPQFPLPECLLCRMHLVTCPCVFCSPVREFFLPSSLLLSLLTCTSTTYKNRKGVILPVWTASLGGHWLLVLSPGLHFLPNSHPPCTHLFFLSFLILFQDFRGTINQFQRHIKAAGSCNPKTTWVFPFSPVLRCPRDGFSPSLHLHFIFHTLPKEPM